MAWRDRSGNPVPGDDGQDKLLDWMYGTAPGRLLVGFLVKPWVSRTAGWLMDTRISSLAIEPFKKKNHIRMDDFEERRYRSFNDFFTRPLKPGARPVDTEPSHLISPCDSKLSVYTIGEGTRFPVKGTEYTMAELVKDEALAKKFYGGSLLLFRLTVGDYHRYAWIDDGFAGKSTRIPGVYHTVNPAAASRLPVYKENTREYTLLESTSFGTVLQMEVGATMVGRIVNAPGEKTVTRGQEKGKFEFGGSTVIVCLQKGAAQLDEDLLRNTAEDVETVVKLGMKIGETSR